MLPLKLPPKHAPVSALALSAALLWGAIELVALARSRAAAAWRRATAAPRSSP